MYFSKNAAEDPVALEAFYADLVKMTEEAQRLQLYEVETFLRMARNHILNRQKEAVDALPTAIPPTLWNREQIY